MFKIVIPGGSGHLGTLLSKHFHGRGHEVVVISRRPATKTLPWRFARWADLRREIDGADVAINLAGRSVDCRYSAKNRAEIMRSRVQSTRAVGEAIAGAQNPPHVWLQMSTATIYAHRFDAANDERTGIVGNDASEPDEWKFSIDVARAWESAFCEMKTPRTRKVLMRSAIVMSATPGAPFVIYDRLVRLGLGGKHGDGRQYISWIHAFDFVRAVEWLMNHRFIDGIVNVASPNPLSNADFLRELREAEGWSFGLRATKAMLEVAAFFRRTETELLLKSRRVVPTRLLETGFRFEFPEWRDAARDLTAQWRQRCESSISRQSSPVL